MASYISVSIGTPFITFFNVDYMVYPNSTSDGHLEFLCVSEDGIEATFSSRIEADYWCESQPSRSLQSSLL